MFTRSSLKALQKLDPEGAQDHLRETLHKENIERRNQNQEIRKRVRNNKQNEDTAKIPPIKKRRVEEL